MTGRRAPGTVPLERALSKLGIASRTRARAMILEGRVRVNGVVRADPLSNVNPDRARIEVDGARAARAAARTIAFHKPSGAVTTRSDEKGRKTIYDVLEDASVCALVAVGRLDQATSGLLLLTNDTRLGDWLCDPVNGVPRAYLVEVRGRVTDEQARALTGGIVDRGERLSAASAILRKSSGKESQLLVELTEGKNRELRRLFSAIGHEVTRLKRLSFGGIELGGLPPGKWRELSADELARAFPAAPIRL